mgnify:CR=1 FL=1|tara:strand:- start:2704 stop:3936 length:1233 start_codon:yes stop_codon:yes gene_type:complete
MTTISSTYNTRGLADAEGSAGARDLGLTIFSGQVLEAFKQRTVFYDMKGQYMASKQLDGGVAAQWPIIGPDIDLFAVGGDDTNFTDDAADDTHLPQGMYAGYHVTGRFITGSKIASSVKTVNVDDILVAAIDVPFLDLDLAHFDLLGPYAAKLGRSIARDLDRKIAALVLKGATDSAPSNGTYPGGASVVRGSASATVAATYTDDIGGVTKFADDVASLALQFDQKFVPEGNRTLFITPYIRKILRHMGTSFVANPNVNTTTQAATVTYIPGTQSPYDNQLSGNSWDLNARSIGQLSGFDLVVTDSMPGDWRTDTGAKYAEFNSASMGASSLAKYDFDCDGADAARKCPAALAVCGAQEGNYGLGMVQAGGMRTIIEDDERRNQKFLKTQMLVGMDILSPWCLGSIACHA